MVTKLLKFKINIPQRQFRPLVLSLMLLGMIIKPIWGQAQNQVSPAISPANFKFVSFNICFDADKFLRPTPQAQLQYLRTDNPDRLHHLNDEEVLGFEAWKNNIFIFSEYYGASELYDLTRQSGLWKLNQKEKENFRNCINQFAPDSRGRESNLNQIWLFSYEIKSIQWTGEKYLVMVYPRTKGLQILHYPKVNASESNSVQIMNFQQKKLIPCQISELSNYEIFCY
jgi:hypothetical protein